MQGLYHLRTKAVVPPFARIVVIRLFELEYQPGIGIYTADVLYDHGREQGRRADVKWPVTECRTYTQVLITYKGKRRADAILSVAIRRRYVEIVDVCRPVYIATIAFHIQ